MSRQQVGFDEVFSVRSVNVKNLKTWEIQRPTSRPQLSLVPLKRLATEMLPQSSHLRTVILSEADTLPRQEALAKMEIFVRLLYEELRIL